MATTRTQTLAALAQQALDQYRADIATGEPVFPQWALDVQQLLEERAAMVTALHRALAEAVADDLDDWFANIRTTLKTAGEL